MQLNALFQNAGRSYDSITSGLLSCVKSFIGRLYQFVARDSIRRIGRDPGSDGYCAWNAGKWSLADDFAQFIRNGEGIFASSLRNDDGEFFATEATGDVHFAK